VNDVQTRIQAGPRRYEVTHRTEYRYEDEVTGSYGRAFLLPRDTDEQWCRSSRLSVSPEPSLIEESTDHFGNRSHYIEIQSRHRVLAVTSTSVLDIDRSLPDFSALNAWTVTGAAAAVRADSEIDAVERATFLLPSPQVEERTVLRQFASRAIDRDERLGDALLGLVHTVYSEFAYASGSTTVTTTLAEVLRKRQGVCQDFAHLVVGVLRLVGLPARYVSGYLETSPPPGKPRLQGADASHAWASVMLPSGRWIDLDPTNDQPADSRYVVTAWGRDYTDVPPLKGVIFTEGSKSVLKVAVDVVRLPDPPS
jgi:transglutaminase-like putative cysteine protease